MNRAVRAFLVCLALLSLAGCELLPGVLPTSSAAGSLEYAGPTDQTIGRGETLPGTNIRYAGPSPDGARVLIGGQEALKKVGDSLDWQGTMVPGVHVQLTQRVININDERLLTGGAVKLTVDGAVPAVATFPDKPLQTYRVPVAYNIARGGLIPGTTIGYVGKAEEGAQLSGVSGYQYRKFGDSISWRGRLRQNVYLDLTVRVVAYADEGMQVTGIATVALVGE